MTIKRICLVSMVWMALTTALVFVPNISPWLATPTVLVGVVFVLGCLLAVNLRIQNSSAVYALYAISLGLAFAMLGGLFVDWLLPYFGILQPLARLPLMIFFDISALVLSACAYLFNKNYRLPWQFNWPDKTSLFFGAVPFAFVVASVCGAELLNNGGTGMLTLVMLFAIAIYVLALVVMRRSVQSWVYVSALYCIALALLLMYSLRSLHILGWDINLEYQVFQMTLRNLRWKMSYYPGLDYNACMSITILPTIFKELTNMPAEYIFKVTFQLLFALTPVAIYAFARRYLDETLAFLAAFLVTSQTWFFEQMPALIRQEVAFIFFAILLVVLFDSQLAKRTRTILFSIVIIALVISHYSTAYVWLALLLVVLLLSYLSRFFIKSLRAKPMIIRPMMLVMTLVVVFIWQVPLTQTATTFTKVVTNSVDAVPAPIVTTSTAAQPSGRVSVEKKASVVAGAVAVAPIAIPVIAIKSAVQNALLTSLFASPNPNTDQNILAAEKGNINFHKGSLSYDVYPSSTPGLAYVPSTITENVAATSALPAWLNIIIAILERADKLLLIDLFPVIGIVVMYLAWRRRPAAGDYDSIALGVGSFILIVLMLAIPYIQVYYNFTRLYLQMLFILSTFAVIGGIAVMKYFPKHQTLVVAIMVVIIFCSLNGSLDQLTGGPKRITLDQPPSVLDNYYAYDTEVAGAQWLAQNRNIALPVQADIIAGLRLQSFAGISVFGFAIFPQTLQRNSYVYLVGKNITDGEAFYEYQNNLLTYNYPLAFLDNHKNLIYNDGGSRVYR